ncbi:MAG: ComF family protein [Rhizobiales bacterium]|nr:ComF family protein [Hyphomicrobiales bacterium]
MGHFTVDLVIPPACLACDTAVTRQGALCPKCWQSLRFITRPYCEVLGTPFAYDLGDNVVCADAIAHEPPFEKARSAVLYDDIARKLVSRLKYEDRPDLAAILAGWMKPAMNELCQGNPVIVPVRLHRWRLLQRRFNQSALIGVSLAKSNHLDFEPIALNRIKNTRQQVGLTRKGRAENVRGAFRVSPQGALAMAKRPVILVDDVVTTGATVEAASRACLRAGASAVRVISFARVADPLGSAAESILENDDIIAV